MNNEDFDEAIRKKLESLNQPDTESDIDKVYSHVQRKRKIPFKGSTGSWLLYSLSAAAFTVVSVMTVSHFKDKSEIAFDSKISKQKINRSIADSTAEPDNTADTAEFKISGNKATDLPETKPEIAPSPVHKTEINTIAKQITSSKSDQTKPAISIPASGQPGKESVINLGVDKSLPPIILAETTADNPVKKDAFVINPDTISNAKTLVSPQLAEDSRPVVSEANPIIIEENKKDNLTKLSDTLLSQKPAEAVPLTDSTAKSKGAKIRAGLDFQLSNQSFGMGVSGELLLANHFSFETGLIYRMYQAVQFPDKDAFFMHQHHDFNHGIDNHFQGKEHISDVSIQNRTLEVPIALKYYIPLKKNFNIYFSLGTNVDIYLNQKLSYTYRADSGMIVNGTFKARGNVVPFNNLVISTGLEKQWKSLSVQIQPYIAPRVKEVFYKPKEQEFGVGVGVKYSFGK